MSRFHRQLRYLHVSKIRKSNEERESSRRKPFLLYETKSTLDQMQQETIDFALGRNDQRLGIDCTAPRGLTCCPWSCLPPAAAGLHCRGCLPPVGRRPKHWLAVRSLVRDVARPRLRVLGRAYCSPPLPRRRTAAARAGRSCHRSSHARAEGVRQQSSWRSLGAGARGTLPARSPVARWRRELAGSREGSPRCPCRPHSPHKPR
jgi:hypothetical protein